MSLSSLPWPINDSEQSWALLWLLIPFLCTMPMEQKASQQTALWPHDLSRTSCSALDWEGLSLPSSAEVAPCSRKWPFWCWTPGSMWRPFTIRNECLMFKICTEDSIWTSPAARRCMGPQMCWLLNTVEQRHVASCSQGLWKRRIHSIYSLFQTRLFNVRMCHKRVICTLNWIVRYRSHRPYDLFLWIKTVCTSQSRTRRVTKHTVYFVLRCSHIFQLPQPNS